MLGIYRSRCFKALITPLLALALIAASTGVVGASGPITFTVRRSPLRVKLLLPAKPVRGRPAIIRAVVRNVGNRRLRAGTVELRVRPRAPHSRAIKRMKVLPARSRRTFTWRARFPKARVYTLTAVARARRAPAKTYVVAGAQKRLVVRKKANALGLFTFNLLGSVLKFFTPLKNLVFP